MNARIYKFVNVDIRYVKYSVLYVVCIWCPALSTSSPVYMKYYKLQSSTSTPEIAAPLQRESRKPLSTPFGVTISSRLSGIKTVSDTRPDIICMNRNPKTALEISL